MEQLLKSDFYFDLPEELIAQDPLEDRSSSRLLVLDKNTGDVEHHVFREIIDYLMKQPKKDSISTKEVAGTINDIEPSEEDIRIEPSDQEDEDNDLPWK